MTQQRFTLVSYSWAVIKRPRLHRRTREQKVTAIDLCDGPGRNEQASSSRWPLPGYAPFDSESINEARAKTDHIDAVHAGRDRLPPR